MPELDFNRIITINAENDRNTSLSFGVFNGFLSATVFANRAMAAKFSLPIGAVYLIRKSLRQAIEGKPGFKVSMPFGKWDPEAKKNIAQGSLFVGRDDKAMIYFGVSAPNNAPMKFVIKSGLGFDLSDPMSDMQKSELQAEAYIDELQTFTAIARALTSFKRENTGGGNRGGGGNYRPNNNGGGSSSGGEDANIF